MAAQAAMLLRCKCKRLFFTRYFSSASTVAPKKGLVLGVYTEEEKGKLILSTAAERYNNKTGGKFLDQLSKVATNFKKGQVRVLYCLDDEFTAVSVVGLAKRCHGYDELEEIDEDREAARQASGVGAKALHGVGLNEIITEDFGDFEAAAEGANLAVWTYQDLKAEEKRKTIPKISSYGLSDADLWHAGTIKSAAQNIARRLMEAPANLLTPLKFAEEAQNLLGPLNNVTIQPRDRAWAEEQKMGAFLSVAQGSAQPPVFLELTYNGGVTNGPPIVLVGKGVTFDSGGISIKPSANMEEMRGDMGGGACVLASIYAAAALKIPINVKGLIPLCENMPGSRATRPGDVVTAMNGKTIQVDNTDAEGRLLLADALCYSRRFQPSCTLDVATLTGAMRVALGGGATGVFTNSSRLWHQIHTAGAYTGDRVWRFPLWQHYSKRMTDYPSVDVNNVGKGKGGGACTAAAFLKEFVESGEWMHLDIAGVMSSSDEVPYLGKGFTGRPVRTLLQFLKQLSSS